MSFKNIKYTNIKYTNIISISKKHFSQEKYSHDKFLAQIFVNFKINIPKNSDLSLLLNGPGKNLWNTRAILANDSLSLFEKQTRIENLLEPLINQVKKEQHAIMPEEFDKNASKLTSYINDNYSTTAMVKKEKKFKDPLEKMFLDQLNLYLAILEEKEPNHFAKVFLLAVHQSIASQFYLTFRDSIKNSENPDGSIKTMESVYEETKNISIKKMSEQELVYIENDKGVFCDIEEDSHIGSDSEEEGANSEKENASNEGFLVKPLDLARVIAKHVNSNFLYSAISLEMNDILIAKDFEEEKNKDPNLRFQDYKKLKFTFETAYEKYFFAFILELLKATELFEETIEKHKKKTVGKFIIKKEIIQRSMTFSNFLPNSPMVHPAADWELRSGDKNFNLDNLEQLKENREWSGLHKGGNLRATEKAVGVSSRNENSHVIPSENVLKLINAQQRTPFKINKHVLQDAIENAPKYAKMHLLITLKEKEIEDIFKIDKSWDYRKTAFDIGSIATYEEFEKRKIEKEGHEKITGMDKLRKNWKNQYNKITTLLADFIIILAMADTYKDSTLYFACYFDGRGRFYFYGHLLFPFGGRLAKTLLDIVFDDIKEIDIDENDQTYRDYYNKIETSNKPKDFFMQRRLCHVKIKANVLALDATASGSSIIAGLTGQLEGLLDTNVLKEEDTEEKKKDMYGLIAGLTKNRAEKSYLIDFPELEKNPEILKILIQFFTRERMKSWLMKYNDSQGAKARVSEMMRYLDDCDGTEGMEAVDQRKLVQYCFAAQEYFLKTIKEQYNLIYLFRETFLEIFKDNWMLERLKVNPKYNQKAGPTLELLKESYSGLLNKKKYKKEYEEAVNYIWESVTKKLPFLIIGTTFDHWISFLYISQEKTEQIGLVGKHGLRSFTLKTQTDIPDSPKLVSSALPHFVHNLDALILTKVVLKCIDMNIRIYTSHDAYQTSPFYAQLIKDLYYEAFIEVTLKQDPIAIFLANNKIELSDYQTKMLDLFANDRKILLKKIELGLLVPSRYILC